MISALKSYLPLSALAAMLALYMGTTLPAGAQQYLGNARERCAGNIIVETPGGTLNVRQFEARSAETGNANITWSCEGQRQQDVVCPPNTNKVLVDRSQGGSTFSIICLHK